MQVQLRATSWGPAVRIGVILDYSLALNQRHSDERLTAFAPLFSANLSSVILEALPEEKCSVV